MYIVFSEHTSLIPLHYLPLYCEFLAEYGAYIEPLEDIHSVFPLSNVTSYEGMMKHENASTKCLH